MSAWTRIKKALTPEPDVIYISPRDQDRAYAAAVKAASEELKRQADIEKSNLLKSIERTKKNLINADELVSEIRAKAADAARSIRS